MEGVTLVLFDQRKAPASLGLKAFAILRSYW